MTPERDEVEAAYQELFGQAPDPDADREAQVQYEIRLDRFRAGWSAHARSRAGSGEALLRMLWDDAEDRGLLSGIDSDVCDEIREYWREAIAFARPAPSSAEDAKMRELERMTSQYVEAPGQARGECYREIVRVLDEIRALRRADKEET
jgi:hypothetical protein